jgi:hypothetical protein
LWHFVMPTYQAMHVGTDSGGTAVGLAQLTFLAEDDRVCRRPPFLLPGDSEQSENRSTRKGPMPFGGGGGVGVGGMRG